ncbi:hypothetical protein [Dickeya zeae]|uniref:hypothetical protein n=1 Tax=Dickeya zeae TaxID=204042 RepID=UPI000367E515|nr:hypothetical protein [Dickeya zeae]UJR55067.1 hypothetical protein J417_14060 [Dickeya zeae MS1]
MLENCVTISSVGVDWQKIIPSIISVIISGVFTLIIFQKKRKDDYLNYLDKQLDDILKIGISHPQFEFKDFCDSWDPIKAKQNGVDSEKYLQYNIYSNLVFNFLARLCAHYNYNEKKISNYVDMKEWIRIHKKIWQKPLNNENENIDTYEQEFINIVNKYIGVII